MRKLSFIVDQDEGLRIDEYAYLNGITKKALKVIKMRGDILVNGIHQTVRYVLHKGDSVVFIYPQEENHIVKENIPLTIVFEDEYLLVIDKSKGLPCIPTRAHPSFTLANALSYYYECIGLDSTIHFVNRLDMDTSGLMVVAKYGDIHQMMCASMHEMKRIYRCHVEGHTDCLGVIELPIYKDGYNMKRVIDSKGQYALTHYKLLSYDGHRSYIECDLKTGRTHQIRVHLSAIGHPLVGDVIYGQEGDFDLDCYCICFRHPITKQLILLRKCGKVNHVY